MFRLARNRRLVASALVIVFLVSIMSATARERERLTRLEAIILDGLVLAQGAAYRAVTLGQELWRELVELRRLEEENERLRAEVARLSGIALEFEEYVRENERLRELVEFRKGLQFQTVAARVVGRSPSGWYRVVVIDKGSAAGVRRNMPVVTVRGLVGRVVRVGNLHSVVMLLSDVDSSVGAQLQRSRDAGVVMGQMGAGGMCKMKLFSRDADIAVGDVVLSSGLGAVFPKGLFIGEVAAIERDDYGFFRYALVRPFVDLERLEEVLVITNAETDVGMEIIQEVGGK